MSGWFKIERESFGHDMFAADEFSRRDAWFWLIAQAAWKPVRVKIKGHPVDLDRGELSASVREMADAWKWSKSRVNRFMAELRDAGMIAIRTRSGTNLGQTSGQTLGQTSDHAAGQGKSIVTICNYIKYQGSDRIERDNEIEISGTNSGTKFLQMLGQHKGKEYNNNNISIARVREGTLDLGEDNNPAAPSKIDYAFCGKVIRLNAKDLDRWTKLFGAIPDIKVELTLLDAHYAKAEANGENVKDWFHRAQRALGNKHQERLERRREQQPAMAIGGYMPPVSRYSYGDDDE